MRAALCTLWIAAAAAAQDLTVEAPPQQGPIAIVGATLHTVDRGVIPHGTLWFDAGRIRGIEAPDARSTVPADAERIDARGLHVWPGLFSANTTVGLQEIGQVRATRDEDETGEATPEVRAWVAVNPDSTVIPVTRANGVLTVAVVPQGDLVPGRASVLQLAGWTTEDMTIDGDCGTVVRWPALPRAQEAVERALAQRDAIDALFRRARAHVEAKRADPTVEPDLRAEALEPVLRGEKPVLLAADHLEQIRTAVTWAIDLGLRPILVGGRDAPLCLDLLRAHAVPVVVTGTHRLPARRDAAVDEPFRLPSVLEEAGLRWCLATDGPFYNERNLPYHAATAVAHGLDRDAALRAITLAPAEILGLGDELGSLTAGKRATLIVTDGDPLEFTTAIRHAFVSGRKLDLSSKHTRLAEKYREKYRQLGILPREK